MMKFTNIHCTSISLLLKTVSVELQHIVNMSYISYTKQQESTAEQGSPDTGLLEDLTEGSRGVL